MRLTLASFSFNEEFRKFFIEGSRDFIRVGQSWIYLTPFESAYIGSMNFCHVRQRFLGEVDFLSFLTHPLGESLHYLRVILFDGHSRKYRDLTNIRLQQIHRHNIHSILYD